jgi:transposase
VLQGPDPEVDGVSTWRLVDFCRIVRERFAVTYGETGMGRLMHDLELSWQTPRPRHAETDRAAQEGFKKRASPLRSRRSQPTIPKPSTSRSGSRTRRG